MQVFGQVAEDGLELVGLHEASANIVLAEHGEVRHSMNQN